MPDPSIQPFTSVFRAGGANRIKRSRPPVSCRACQRRKSKCDRQRPCGACEKRNEGAQCHFGSHSAGNGGHEGGRHEIQARVNKLEELVRGLADSGKSPVPPGSAEVPAGGDQEASERIYAGPLSWRALMDSIHDIQDVLGMERDGSPSHDIEENTTASDVLIGEGPRITIKEVAAAMPSKQETDRLVMTYFGAKFLAVPFIHTHQFRRCYEAFWEDPSSQSFLWISLMFSVLSMGAFIAESKNADSKPPSPVLEPNFFMAQAARCLVVGDYLRAKRLSVEATLAHAHSRHIQKRDSDSNVWTLYGVATRLALRRGYHRDYTKVSANITPFEAEMRRRTWFLISSSDTLLSFQHGLPPIIHDDLCDTGHLTNLTDEDFDEDTILPPPRPRTDPLPTLAYVFKSKLAVTLRRIIHHVLRPLSNDNYQETTFILQSNLEEWHAAIPPCFHYRTISSTAFTDPNYTIMHRIMLEIMCRKAMCVLHRPYLSVRGKGNEYKLSREICRDSALKLMNIHLELDAAIQPGGRLYEDRYMLNSLTLTEFLVAAMIICVDLSESIDMRYVI